MVMERIPYSVYKKREQIFFRDELKWRSTSRFRTIHGATARRHSPATSPGRDLHKSNSP